MYMYNGLTLLYSRKQHNIVKQFYSKKKKEKLDDLRIGDQKQYFLGGKP